MKIFNLKLPKYFGPLTPVSIDEPVIDSINHFNWFARYSKGNEKRERHRIAKITAERIP